jgi:hypothetical protein
LALFTLVISVQPASAAVVVYDNLSTWQSNANQTAATVDFSAFAPNPGNNFPNQSSIVAGDATITSPSNFVGVYNPSPAEWWYQWNTGGAILRSENGVAGAIRVDLAAALTAMALNVGVPNYNGSTYLPSQVTLQVGSGAVVLWQDTLPTPAKPDSRFVGIVATEAFNWVLVTPALNYSVIDDLRLGEALAGQQPPGPDPQPAPEPWVLFTAGSGLVAMGIKRYRMARTT